MIGRKAGVVLAIAGTVALGAIVSASVQAPAQVTLDWVRQYSGMRAVALVLAPDGSIYVTGPSLQDAQHNFREDIITIKYDQAGNQVWAQEFDETADAMVGSDISTWISLDPDGNVLVTGSSFLNGLANFVTLKYDPAGNLLWRAHSSLGRDAVRVAADAAGNVYVTGYTAGSGANFVTLKYDPDGVQQWMQTYNGPNNFTDRALSLAVSPAGEVVVTGESTGGISGFDAATIFYESNGSQRWLRRFNGAANGNDYGRDVVLGSSGEVHVAGQTATASGFLDALLIKYDSAGNQIWVRTFDGPSQKSDSFGRVVLDSQGGVATAGFSQAANFTSDFLAARHDANGNRLWTRTFNGPDNNEDIGFGLAVGLDDSIYVTGESFSKVGTVRYLPDGTLEWSQIYDNPGTLSDRGYGVAVDPQDNVVVAAQSPLLTLHYSQGGSNPLVLHVGDLDGTSVRVGARWQATVTLTTHDGDHAALAGVTVTGLWTGAEAASCTTNGAGQCSVVSRLFNRARTSVTFTVTAATASGYVYDPAANHDPDGDSNGTAININRPG